MDNTQTQKTVQSFKITNIRQLDHEGMVTETETPVTRQQIAKVLSETILGVGIEQFEDHWAGNLQIDINIFEDSDEIAVKRYFANVYKVETDEHGMTSQGDCIADFDIELYTDRKGDHILLECEGCGEILTLGEAEERDDFCMDLSDYRSGCGGSIIPFAECWQDEDFCGQVHEFDYSKLVPQITKPEPIIKVILSVSGGTVTGARVKNDDQGKVVIELWDFDNIGRHGRRDEAQKAWDQERYDCREVEIDTCRFDQPAWIDAYRAWPESAFVTFRDARFPFTEINGVKIGCDSLNGFLLKDGEHVSEEAKEIDDQFGYYVPFEIMMQGDKATWEYIKKEIDEDFAGGSPE